jgi:2-phospho-L-lactate guanylyltransferase
VPSRDGTGTNALLRTPPELFPSRFGAESCAKHLAEARARGAEIRVFRNARIELDIDEVEDLRYFFSTNGDGAIHTRSWLAEHSDRMTSPR